jgi:hypothetical protein
MGYSDVRTNVRKMEDHRALRRSTSRKRMIGRRVVTGLITLAVTGIVAAGVVSARADADSGTQLSGRLAENGQSLTLVARVIVLDPDGNVLSTFGATASGERVQVEHIADQP